MTLLRRLVMMRRWLEWEHVRGLNNLKCCEKEVVGRRVEEMRGIIRRKSQGKRRVVRPVVPTRISIGPGR